jgi:hypothetical protein
MQMTEYQRAQLQLRAANEELEQAKFKASQDPNNPAAKQRLLSAQASTERAQAYMIRAQAAAFGSYNGQPLSGALETPEGTPIGSSFSGAYTRAIQPTGQINDAQGAVNQVGDALSALYKSGSSLLNPNVAQALAHHDWTSAQLLQGLVAQNLSPAERDAVTAIIAARENIQALRKASGGGISNAQIDRMIAMLPSPATPNALYAARQLELLNLMIGRLAKTIPATVGGPKLDVNSPVNSPANSVTLKSRGKVYNIPIDQVDAFRKDHPDASR